jgi:hypothetical protein
MRLTLDTLDVLAIVVGTVALLTVIVLSGCAPDTDLFDEPLADQLPGAGAAAAGRSGAVLVDPAAGTRDVPPNLSAITVRFPAPVHLGEGALRLRPPGPPLGAPAQTACEGTGACYRVPVMELLEAQMTYALELAGGVDQAGASLSPGLIGEFDTGSQPDQQPPVVADLTVEPAGPCVAVRFDTDEPVEAQVVLRAPDIERLISGGAGSTTFDLAVPMRSMPADSDVELAVRAVDRAGNMVETAAFIVHTPALLMPLAITEVLANPAGAEPTQEYVELRNLGETEISLEGLRIEDSRGADLLPPVVLPAGGYGLVVAMGYDPRGGQDPAPAGAAVLIRVDSRIGSDGLSNAGEAVRLSRADLSGSPLSSYGGWTDTSSSPWSGKSVHRPLEDACDHPTGWTRTPLPPTPGAPPPGPGH